MFCPVCTEVLERPLELKCGRMICLSCLIRWVQVSCALSCPCCHDHTLNSDSMWSPSPITMAMLGSLPVTCGICCSEVQVQQLTRHLDTKCSTLFRHDSPSKTTIKDILSKPGTSTPSPAERRVAGTLIKRMMMDGNSGVVQVPTGSHGQVCRKYTHFHIAHYNNYKQPLTLMQVPSCRVPTSEASPITIRRRSHQLAKVRDTISGGASLEQLQSEIRCLSKEERQEILKDANLPISIPADHVLAMKADLALPWAKLRVIAR